MSGEGENKDGVGRDCGEKTGEKSSLLSSIRCRRNLLFLCTLATLLLVFLGAVPLHPLLSAQLLRFTIFWAFVFVLAAFVLGLALYDLSRVRRDHGKRVRELEKELAAAAAEARELMRRRGEEAEDEDSDP